MVPERWQNSTLGDTLTVEWVSWVPLLVLVLVLGVFPGIIFGVTNDSVRILVHLVGA